MAGQRVCSLNPPARTCQRRKSTCVDGGDEQLIVPDCPKWSPKNSSLILMKGNVFRPHAKPLRTTRCSRAFDPFKTCFSLQPNFLHRPGENQFRLRSDGVYFWLKHQLNQDQDRRKSCFSPQMPLLIDSAAPPVILALFSQCPRQVIVCSPGSALF